MYESKGITLNVGKVYGGEGRNSIPSKVCFDWEIRYKNDLLKNQVINEIDILCKKLEEIYSCATIVTEIKETLPVFNEKEKSVISQVAKNILKTELMSYPYASEAGFWQAVGIDTLICGAGDLNLAHKSNEYVQISDIEKYTKFLSVFLQNISELSE